MFSEEIKQVVYVAVTCILLALVLTFASNLLKIKQDIVATRQDTINTNAVLHETKKFDKYNNKSVSGLDVIDAIAEFKKDRDMQVVIVYRNTNNRVIYNYAKYEANRSLGENSEYTLTKLQQAFVTNSAWHAYTLSNVPDLSTNTTLLNSLVNTSSKEFKFYLADTTAGGANTILFMEK